MASSISTSSSRDHQTSFSGQFSPRYESSHAIMIPHDPRSTRDRRQNVHERINDCDVLKRNEWEQWPPFQPLLVGRQETVYWAVRTWSPRRLPLKGLEIPDLISLSVAAVQILFITLLTLACVSRSNKLRLHLPFAGSLSSNYCN